jgi:hypothetical protein
MKNVSIVLIFVTLHYGRFTLLISSAFSDWAT